MFVRAGIVYNVDTRNPTTKRQFLSRSKFREKGAWPAGMSDEQLLPRTGQCDVQEISFLLDKQIFFDRIGQTVTDCAEWHQPKVASDYCDGLEFQTFARGTACAGWVHNRPPDLRGGRLGRTKLR